MSRLAHAGLWLTVAVYALSVAHAFFRYSASAVYLSTDDALANIAYAIATEGRYGFLSSPILFEMPRHVGLFSYGPFYFYVAAALVWLFGYSLTVVRSVHLLVMIAIAVAARSWFGRRAAGAAGAIAAVSVLAAFEHGQWPMVRPDSMVSLCAIALAIAAGLAISTGQARYWAVAGVAAGCGALTHLVAWSLIPASVVILALASVIEARAAGGRMPARLVANVLALAAGGIVSAVLFYASFGFRVGDQLRFLGGYQEYTGSMAGAGAGSFGSLLLQHFERAYSFLPFPLEYLVVLTLVTGIGAIVFLLARPRASAAAMIIPPVVIWVGYLLSLGFYNNFHAGYTILNQVMAAWCFASLIAIALDAWFRDASAAGAAAWVLAFGFAVAMLTVPDAGTSDRALASRAAVPIDEYTSRVLEPLPADARAWGSVVFGIEHPGRVQLIQLDDAMTMAGALDRETRLRLAPDYLILGVADAGAPVIGTLSGQPSLPRSLAGLLPGVRFDVVAMTAGAPYGVTRVYARRQDRSVEPSVSVYDAERRQWTRTLAPPVTLTMTPASPAEIQVDGVAAKYTAVQTLSADLPAGAYVIRVALPANARDDFEAAFAASSGGVIRGSFGEYGAVTDVAAAFPGAQSVDLVYAHPGGAFFVSQFGAGPPAMSSVQASRLVPLPDFNAQRRTESAETPLHAVAWTLPDPIPQTDSRPVRIIHTPAADGRSLNVDGNAVQYGYQAFGPDISVEPFSFVRLRLAATMHSGTACWGVLDGTGERWLVLPDRLQSEYEFQVNDSTTIKPVLADCTGVPGNTTPVKATIRDGAYATWPARGELYVDELVRAFQQRR